MRLLENSENVVNPFVSNLIFPNEQECQFLSTDKSWGFLVDNQLVGGVVLNNHIQNASIEQSTATINPRVFARRDLFFRMFSYCFKNLNVKSIFSRVAETDDRSIKLTEGFGFSYAGYIRYGYNESTGLLIYDMTLKDFLTTPWVKSYIKRIKQRNDKKNLM